MTSPFDARPIIVAIAGPNGAGKSTFLEAHLASAGLLFLNADDLARELKVDAATAAELANRLRVELVEQRETFVFETVLSDPVGDKVDFLAKAAAAGYTVVMVFIGIDDAGISEQRVAIRVLQGGHDVPTEKLSTRFPRTMKNLVSAIQKLPHVLVFDNSDLANPFRKVAEFRGGKPVSLNEPIPRWVPVKRKKRGRGGGRR
ncbi:MAG: zeta toxin family protein [Myxococcales bacterium]|nr:zeta toxin family protein [Myxococcales bacterium]